jgi:hypothetical protein
MGSARANSTEARSGSPALQVTRETEQLRAALLSAETELASASQLKVDYQELRAAADELRERCSSLEAELDWVRGQYELIATSSSWTLTAPLRRVMSAARGRGSDPDAA